MSEGVTGNLAIKLKNVPWDQALVLILKAKKRGYTRQGNVLRISLMAEIKQEEDAMKLDESQRKFEPLKVQMIPINYAKIYDIQGQIKSVITERGNIVADGRTNSLILTETEGFLGRAKKFYIEPGHSSRTVMIEGKLVEANITQIATVPVVASQNKKEGFVTYKDLNLKMDLKVTAEIASNGVVQMKVDISREFLGTIRDDGSAGFHQRTAKTKVVVKSGQTAVIGGIYQND